MQNQALSTIAVDDGTTDTFFWTSPYAGDFYIEVTTDAAIDSIRAYFLTVYKANGGTLLQVTGVLRGLDQIVKFFSFAATTTVAITFTNSNSGNIVVKASGTTTTLY